MADITTVVRLECKDLTTDAMLQWIKFLDKVHGTTKDWPVEAKRREDGSIYLQVKGWWG